jgi:hypothetical protein
MTSVICQLCLNRFDSEKRISNFCSDECYKDFLELRNVFKKFKRKLLKSKLDLKRKKSVLDSLKNSLNSIRYVIIQEKNLNPDIKYSCQCSNVINIEDFYKFLSENLSDIK